MITLTIFNIFTSIFNAVYNILPTFLQNFLNTNVGDIIDFYEIWPVVDTYINYAFYFIPINIFRILLIITVTFAICYLVFAIVHLLLNIT